MARTPKQTAHTVRVASSIGEINPAAWDACANPEAGSFNPFVSHAFLATLEDAGCVRARAGWLPQHLVLEDGCGTPIAVMPCYLKGHSQGEFVFDYAWADAWERAGGQYYPKLLSAVPFTPVPGPRLLAGSGPGRQERQLALVAGAMEYVRQRELSSFHINFASAAEVEALEPAGLLHRTDKQFHWKNEGYATFEDFLSALASRKRKTVRRERRTALEDGLQVEWVSGGDITEAHWDAFFAFYMDTGSRKWGSPYLNRKFFSVLSTRMADRLLLILVRRSGGYIAGALNVIGGDTLYGRYWGCTEHHDCLHFEVCYYQAIDYAIQHGLKTVEAGAQGEHKLARGYVPVTTHSLHYLPDANFRRAVSDYLDRERIFVERQDEALRELAPFRKSGARPGPGQ